MKKNLRTSVLGMGLALLSGGLFAQQMVTPAQLDQRGTYDVKFQQDLRGMEMTLSPENKQIAPTNSTLPNPNGVQAVNFVELGRASNSFTILRPQQNQVFASDDLNMVTFMHRQDVTIFGGGGTANGKLRYDFSTDGGATFTNDVGPLQTVYTNYGRYPQVTGYNPTGNSNPFSSYLAFSSATNRFPTPGWIGHLYGVSDVTTGTPTATEHYLFDVDPTLIPGGLCQGLPGEFWNVEFAYDGSALMDSIFVYKGTWNSGTTDIDWVRYATINPGYDKSYDGSISAVGPNIAFSPDGMTGYIGLLTDLTGGPTNYVLSPTFIKTTDGGVTWGAPVETDLSSISWIADSLTSYWVSIDTVTGDTVPAGTGIPTTGFDYDLTVDANGNPHLAVLIGNSPAGGGYSISSGLEKFIADVTSDDGGATWEVKYIGAALAFRGEFGTPDPNDGSLLTIDNYVQCSRTEDGSKIFFSWMDSDTAVIGVGESANLAPNLRIAGLQVSNDYQTPVVKVTDGDFVWEGKVLCPTMAPTVLSQQNGNYSLPIVVMEMITNDQGQPCKFWYAGGDAVLNDACFDMVSNLELGAPGFVHKDTLSCLSVGIEEEIAREGLAHAIFPNPATNNATVRFELPEAAEAQVRLMNMYGQVVLDAGSRRFTAGMNDVELNTASLASGVYFYQLEVAGQIFSNKLVISK